LSFRPHSGRVGTTQGRTDNVARVMAERAGRRAGVLTLIAATAETGARVQGRCVDQGAMLSEGANVIFES
jgi:hypothetical protein